MFTGHINLCPDCSKTHLYGSGTFVRGPERSWKCSECPETVPVCPGRSWKLLEGHGRFQKVLGSTTHSPAPLALGSSHLGCPGRPGGGGAPRRGESSRWDYRFPLWQVSGGKVWEALEGLGVQVGLPNLLELRPRPLGHLYKVSQGWGEDTHKSPAPLALPSC